MQFKDPLAFVLLIIPVALALYYWLRARKNHPALKLSTGSLLKQMPIGLRARLRYLPQLLRIAGICLLVVALARPQRPLHRQEVTTEGLDILLVQDISESMRALDFQPNNRLFVAKQTMSDFIEKRRHDRLGLVVFGQRAYTKCPLTLDYRILQDFVDRIDFESISQQTAIGLAIATAAKRLAESQAKDKVMILLTDGSNNAGDIPPLTAASAASELGIKIYTIGIGKKGLVPYPAVNMFGQTVTQNRESDLDEETLVSIAKTTDGRYYRATDAKQLESIYNEIDKLEKTEIKTLEFTNYEELFYSWLFAGAALILLDMLLAATVLRRFP